MLDLIVSGAPGDTDEGADVDLLGVQEPLLNNPQRFKLWSVSQVGRVGPGVHKYFPPSENERELGFQKKISLYIKKKLF